MRDLKEGSQARDDALLGALREQLSLPELAWDEPPALLGRGAESTVLSVSLVGIRDSPSAPLVARLLEAGDAAQVAREAAIQGALTESGFPAPRPVAHGAGVPGVLQPFLVMEKAEGRVLFSLLPALLLAVVALFALDLAILGLLLWVPWFLVPVILQRRLHSIPVDEFEKSLESLGAEPREFGFPAWFQRLEGQIGDLEQAGLEPGLAWLRANAPSTGNAVLCHGDYWAGNILIAKNGAITLIDWPNATLAPPEFDLGWIRVQDTSDLPSAHGLREPWRSRVGRLWQPIAWIGLRPHSWLYRLFHSLDKERLDYFAAFHCIRILAWSFEQEQIRNGELNLWSSQRARRLVTRRFARITGVQLRLDAPSTSAG